MERPTISMRQKYDTSLDEFKCFALFLVSSLLLYDKLSFVQKNMGKFLENIAEDLEFGAYLLP